MTAGDPVAGLGEETQRVMIPADRVEVPRRTPAEVAPPQAVVAGGGRMVVVHGDRTPAVVSWKRHGTA